MINNKVTTGHGQEDHPMAFLLEDDLGLPTIGETRVGHVVAHRANEILVDIGAKSEGIITGTELQRMDQETRDLLAVGEEVEVYVVSIEDQHGNVVVSYAKAAEKRDWVQAEKYLKSQDVIKVKVSGHNRGGVLARLGQLRGFIPNSQLSHQNSGPDKDLSGQTISVKVLEVDPDRNRLILSEKAAKKESRQARRAELFEQLSKGDVRNGRVINLADFGAFVDIGGVEGLVHLSEISWKRIDHPGDLLEVGQEVKVSVISIDRERERLALSLKRLEADPWSSINELYQEGQLREAVVTKLTPYGAFARLQDEYELEGLIHISELSEDHIKHPNEVVKPSQTVTVRIIRVDQEQRQLGLSIKQVVSDKFVESDLEMLNRIQD